MPPVDPAVVQPGATYAALGDYIGSQSPYGTRVTLPSFEEPGVLGQTDATAAKQMDEVLYPGHHAVVLYGVSKDNNAGNVVTFMPEADLIASLQGDDKQRVMRWETHESENGVERTETHLVTKAIRVWYTYKIEVPVDKNNPTGPKETIDVGTFLLVGFVGHGQP